MRQLLTSISNRIPVYRQFLLDRMLAEFSRAAVQCDSVDEIHVAVNQLVSNVIKSDRIAIHFLDENSQAFTEESVLGQVTGWESHATRPLAGTVVESVYRSGQTLDIADCDEESVVQRFPGLKAKSSPFRSLICVPMFSAGEPVGAIVIRSKKRNAYSQREVEVLERVTAHFTPVLVNVRESAFNQREVRERTVLAEIGRLASSTIDMSRVWGQLIELILQLIPGDRIVLAVVEEDGATITDRFVYGVRLEGWDDNPEREKITVPADGIIRSQRAEVVEMDENDAAHFDLLGYKMSERSGLKTSMYAPLMAGERAIGTISLRSRKERAFSEGDRVLFEKIAKQIGGPVAAAELYSRSVRLAKEMESRFRLEVENKKLEEMNETKARFISMVSHELRTPLTSMIAFTDLVLRNKNETLSERDLSQLEVVKRNSSRLKLLIEDLLSMSAFESGNISVVRSEFSLRDLINQLFDALKPILSAKNQKLIFNESNPDIQVTTDQSRLEQVLSNLISNASKYSARNARIEIEVKSTDDWLTIAVIDSGEGIDEADIPSIFDEFRRLDNLVTRENQGSGLGLSISRRLMHALGGTLSVESKKGEGSVFTVTLPLNLMKAA